MQVKNSSGSLKLFKCLRLLSSYPGIFFANARVTASSISISSLFIVIDFPHTSQCTSSSISMCVDSLLVSIPTSPCAEDTFFSEFSISISGRCRISFSSTSISDATGSSDLSDDDTNDFPTIAVVATKAD